MTGLQTAFLLLALFLCETSFSAGSSITHSSPQTQRKSVEAERDRMYLRQEFQKNFKNLQQLGGKLLQEHEAAKLTPDMLVKAARSIQKCAKTLRTFQALGEMARPTEINREIDTPQEFDNSIRKLAKLIRDFAHNPVHQNSKVFNTDQAEQAQTDLLAIIVLSKVLENKSKNYKSTVDQSGSQKTGVKIRERQHSRSTGISVRIIPLLRINHSILSDKHLVG